MSKQNYVCLEGERFANLVGQIYEGCDTRVMATAMIPISDEPMVNVDEYDSPQDYYLVILSEYMSRTLEVYRVDQYGNYPIQYNELDEPSVDNVDAHPPIYRQANASWGAYTLAVDMIYTGRFDEWIYDRRRLGIGTINL